MIDNKWGGGEVLYEIVILEFNGECVYMVNEEGKIVFIVLVLIGIDVWLFVFSRIKKIIDVGNYLDLFSREKIEMIIYEKDIEWID